MNGFFITGTDTDVGKTFVTAALLKALKNNFANVKALKPIQTGCIQKDKTLIAPDVQIYKLVDKNSIEPKFAYETPASPAYAASLKNEIINFDELVRFCNDNASEITLIEGAGGIYTPINNEFNFIDLIKELNMACILVCNNKLGSINHILLNIQALKNNGIKLAAIIINNLETNEITKSNIEFLKNKMPTSTIIELNKFNCINEASKIFIPFLEKLINKLEKQDIDLEFEKSHILHPYDCITKPLKTYFVEKTEGNYIFLKNKKLIDGMSSWWCAIHGYNNEKLKEAAISQINKMPHIMFGGLTHQSAIKLGKNLLKIVPKGLNYIFYCDSGSVSVEIAIKMALQYWQSMNRKTKNKILTPLGGYHGDTFGAMSVCDPVNGMHKLFKNTICQQIFIQKPSCAFNDKFNKNCLDELQKTISQKHKEIAAIILEPIVQGAGGMWIYHKNYLKNVRKLCDKFEILLICDEIATGFGRTGKLFACKHSNITPDIMCVGKALTGGFMSFGATLANSKVAKGISANNMAFMHGPTFMANPIACEVANASIEFLLQSSWKKNVKNIENILKENLIKCYEFDIVKDIRCLGAIGIVEIKKIINIEKIQDFFVKKGVWIRPFSKNIYIMPPFTINKKDLIYLCESIYEALKFKHY